MFDIELPKATNRFIESNERFIERLSRSAKPLVIEVDAFEEPHSFDIGAASLSKAYYDLDYKRGGILPSRAVMHGAETG